MKKAVSLLLSFVMLFSIIAGLDLTVMAKDNITKILINVTQNYDYINEMLNLINKERTKRGLNKLKLDKELTEAALQRAAECSLLCAPNHLRPNGKSFKSVNKKIDRENIAWGGGGLGWYDPQQAMIGLLESEGHKENILSSKNNSVGIGCVIVNNYAFYVQDFSNDKCTNKYSKRGINQDKQVSIEINSSKIQLTTDNQWYLYDTDGIRYEDYPDGYQFPVYCYHKDTFVENAHPYIDNSAFTFQSSNNDIFTVDSNGVINIKKSGKATLTIILKSNNNIKIKQKIKVNKTYNVLLSKTCYTYNGKVRTPSVTVKDSKGKILKKNTDYTVTYAKGRKSVGKYNVTIKFKGNYSGTVTKTFTIKPKSTSISKLTAGKKKFTVKWKKQTTQTTGYQIQYSTSSKFKNAKTVTVSKNTTTSKSVSKLKAKKKYYVRVRTYKIVKVNGKNTKIYSSWSKAKSVTTKK